MKKEDFTRVTEEPFDVSEEVVPEEPIEQIEEVTDSIVTDEMMNEATASTEQVNYDPGEETVHTVDEQRNVLAGVTKKIRQLDTFFSTDKDISIGCYKDENKYIFQIASENYFKAVALRMLLPAVYETDIPLEVLVYAFVDEKYIPVDLPAGEQRFVTCDMLKSALESNDIVQEVRKIYRKDFNTETNFVIFKRDSLIQFSFDDIGDYQGVETELPEDTAREIFPTAGVNWCTAV